MGMAVGDYLSQKAEKYFFFVEPTAPVMKKDTNWSRLFNVVLFASLIGVPSMFGCKATQHSSLVLHFYYLFLEFLFPGQNPIHIFLKVCCDVFLFTPLSILGFFAGIGFMEGRYPQWFLLTKKGFL
jgi:hypothetical protein